MFVVGSTPWPRRGGKPLLSLAYCVAAWDHWRRFDRHRSDPAVRRDRVTVGKSKAISNAMMLMTTSSSTSVKARPWVRLGITRLIPPDDTNVMHACLFP